MHLFPDEAALEQAGYLFRITDNGGATYDRYTIATCDGDAMLAYEGGICTTVESFDPQISADDVEAGTAIDLRWIDLPAAVRSAALFSLNRGFSDYIERAPAAPSRDEARDWEGQWQVYNDEREAIYKDGDSFYIRDDERRVDDGDPGPFETFAEAVRAMLPQDYDLAGPEYHTTVDLWDTEGGPAEPWDCEQDPATPYEVEPRAKDYEKTSPHTLPLIAEARDVDHAIEIGRQWRKDNPELAKDYEPTYVNKVDRVVHRID